VFIRFKHANALSGFQLWLVLAVEILTAIGFSIAMMLFFDEPVRAWLSKKWQLWRHEGPALELKSAAPMRTINRQADGRSEWRAIAECPLKMSAA
jgi:peptidoglycan/LPS O-acetylase OafA/YrhL